MSSDKYWSPSESVPGVSADSHEPAIALLAETLHVVWVSNKVLYHAAHTSEGWTHRVKLASGEQPALAITSDKRLHCLFTNQFVGNYEIYHVTWDDAHWSLPKPVSRTIGASTHPELAVAPDGSLHAVWADTTPGYSTIYHGKLQGMFWSSVPVPNGRGSMPALAITESGDLYVAWQDRLTSTGHYAVFCSVHRDGTWSLPEMVSDSPDSHSLQPQLAASQGRCQMVWQEEHASLYGIRHSAHEGGWSKPVDVSSGRADCRLPRIVVNRQGFLQVVWLEGQTLLHRIRPPDSNATWWVAETADGEYWALNDFRAVLGQTGELHVVWSGSRDSDTRLLYYARRQPIITQVVIKP